MNGYSYQGAKASVAVEIRVGPDYPYRCATIYLNGTDGLHPVAEHEFGTLRGGYQWLSRTLDGKPKIFNKYSLVETERLRSINGDGAEYFVMSTLMLEYGMSVGQAHSNMPGYDLTVEHPNTKRSCKLQVKFVSTPRWPAVNSQDFDFLVVVAPKPSAMAQLANEPTARREQRFTAYVIPVSEVQAKCDRSLMRSPLRGSAYEWAWESVIDYLHLS
jgi:hypothetical protein